MNKIKSALTNLKNALASVFVFCFLTVVGWFVVGAISVVGFIVVPLGALKETLSFYNDVNEGN